jgi:hypothetical protein
VLCDIETEVCDGDGLSFVAALFSSSMTEKTQLADQYYTLLPPAIPIG